MHFAIIGAGPAGLSLAARILKLVPSARINIFEKRNAPYGLARYGVAPDHSDARKCIHGFAETISDERVQLYKGVPVGDDKLDLDKLKNTHDAVIIATGLQKPKLMGIKGEGLANSFSSDQIYSWYNGEENHENLNIPFDRIRKVAIIGHGNVALDISRIFLKSSSLLRSTDISPKALQKLSESKIDHVEIIGRRGPLQVSFTISELRSIFKAEGFGCVTDQNILNECMDKYIDIWKLSRSKNRLFSLMKTDFVKDLTQFDKFCHFKFLRKPLEILGDKSVSGLVMKPCVMKDATIKDWHQLEKMQSIEDPTAPLEIKPFDLIVSCIGSTNDKLINLPIDSYGKILNTDGAVNGVPGVYVCGWAATGGKGDLTETFRSGRELAQKIIRETEASPNLQPFFY